MKTAFYPVFVSSEKILNRKAGGPVRRFSGRPLSLLLLSALMALSLLFSCAVANGPAEGGLKNKDKNENEKTQSAAQASRVLQKVPYYSQADHQCGPAALAEVLGYYGADATPGSIASSIYSKTAKGTLGIDMLIYSKRAGFEASQYSGGKRDLMKQIDAGHPLIVFVDYGFWVYQRGHFMVVDGYDANGPVVNSVDGPFEHITWKEFMGPWKKTGYWTLLIEKEKTRTKIKIKIKNPSASGKTK